MYFKHKQCMANNNNNNLKFDDNVDDDGGVANAGPRSNYNAKGTYYY